MSLSKPIEKLKTNPVKRYYTFNGATGTLSYYDKETEQKAEVTEKFLFIPTDERNVVEGFDSKKEMGFRSNEVISTAKEELTIRWNNGQILMKGFYNDLKDKIKAQGGKYTKSIYGITKINNEWELINLKLKGAAFSAWLEFDKLHKGSLIGLTIGIIKGEEKKSGMVRYFEPIFKAKATPVEIHEIARNKDIELQEYFSSAPLNESTLPAEVIAPMTASEKAEIKELKKANKKVVEVVAESDYRDNDSDDFFDTL
jgi:hypothetical protein